MTCVQITPSILTDSHLWLSLISHAVEVRSIRGIEIADKFVAVAFECEFEAEKGAHELIVGSRVYFLVPHVIFESEDDAAMFLLKFGGVVVQ